MPPDRKTLIIIRNRPRLDTLLVLGSIGVMLWTGRILVLVLTDHWFGTLGVSSCVLVPLIYCSKKGKLGWYGRAVMRWIDKTKKKKITIPVILGSLFMFYLFGFILAGLHYSAPENIQAALSQLHTQGIDTPQQAMSAGTEQLAARWWAFPVAIGMMFAMPVVAFPIWSDMVGTIDSMLGGLLFTISQIAIIEEVEILGIFLWSRFR